MANIPQDMTTVVSFKACQRPLGLDVADTLPIPLRALVVPDREAVEAAQSVKKHQDMWFAAFGAEFANRRSLYLITRLESTRKGGRATRMTKMTKILIYHDHDPHETHDSLMNYL